MSYYAVFDYDAALGGDIASNNGWATFVEFVENNVDPAYKQIHRLADTGMCEYVRDLYLQLEQFGGQDDTVDELLRVLPPHPPNGAVLVITDGAGVASDGIINIFCATGEGGGVDPTCKKDDDSAGGAWDPEVHSLGNVKEDLEYAETTKHVQAILDHYGFERLDASGIVADFISRDLYQNTDGDLVEWDGKEYYTSYTPASEVHQWINEQDVSGIEGYLEEQFNKDFWSQRPGNLYHATPSENIESVKQHGIQVDDRTRGMSNRNTGPAIYTTAEFDEAEAGIYGDAVFEIDTAAMRADKNTPYVALEPDVAEGEARSALASALNVDDYEYEYESGMSPNTVVVFGSIPAKYVKLVE